MVTPFVLTVDIVMLVARNGPTAGTVLTLIAAVGFSDSSTKHAAIARSYRAANCGSDNVTVGSTDGTADRDADTSTKPAPIIGTFDDL